MNLTEFYREYQTPNREIVWFYSNRVVVMERSESDGVVYHFLSKTVSNDFTYIDSNKSFEEGKNEAIKVWDASSRARKVCRTVEEREAEFLGHVENMVVSFVRGKVKRRIFQKMKDDGTKNPVIPEDMIIPTKDDYLENVTLDSDNSKLSKYDFSVVYHGADLNWHAWYPTSSQLIGFHTSSNEVVEPGYVDFLGSDEFAKIREAWGSQATIAVPRQN